MSRLKWLGVSVSYPSRAIGAGCSGRRTGALLLAAAVASIVLATATACGGAGGASRASASGSVASCSSGGRHTGQTVGGNGWVVSMAADAVEIAADGKIVAAGSSGGDFALARYQPDGKLDQSFANGGTACLDFGRLDAASVIAFQHGMTLVGGAACTVYEGLPTADQNGPCAFALARYRPDGKLDPQFGNAGTALTPLGKPQFSMTALVARPTGAILAAGGGLLLGGALVRYTATGQLDPAFGDRGITRTPFSVLKNGLTVQPDGRILVAGFSYSQGPSTQKVTVLLARYTANGHLDKTWGVSGIAKVAFDPHFEAAAAVFQRDGRVVVLGDSARGFVLARYTKDGRPDGTFGSGGASSTALGGPDGSAEAVDIALGPDGAIVAVGTFWGDTLSPVVARYGRDGVPDATFGTRGRTITRRSDDVDAQAIALQPDGKILVVGDALLARYLPNGRLDPSFGGD
jgi:uncharacterized delta-60 repeat protein